MRTVTAKQIAYALGCTAASIREREGRTMPRPIDAKAAIHEYDLRSVLLAVNGMERTRLSERLHVDVTIAISDRELKEFDVEAEPEVMDDFMQRQMKVSDSGDEANRFF